MQKYVQAPSFKFNDKSIAYVNKSYPANDLLFDQFSDSPEQLLKNPYEVNS